MIKAVIADTTPLYALVDSSDQYHLKKITLFDAVTASISQRLNTPVWTYDHHFDLMLIPVWRLN